MRLLQSIKGEYDFVVDTLERQRQSMVPTQSRLAAVEEQTIADRLEQQHSFMRETHGMREAVRTAQQERTKLLHRCEMLATQLQKAEVQMERDAEFKKEKDEMNSTLSTALNSAKLRNKEVIRARTLEPQPAFAA